MSSESSRTIESALRLMRNHLDLDVAFVSHLREGKRVFQHVNRNENKPRTQLVQKGGSDPEEDSYCYYVTQGTVPEFLKDPAKHPVTGQMEATHAFPVGTHFSVPILLSNGETHGTLCGFSLEVQEHAKEENLKLVRMLVEMVKDAVEDEENRRKDQIEKRQKLLNLQAGKDFQTVFQPIVNLQKCKVKSFEGLTRFDNKRPDLVFEEAWNLQAGFELEMKAAEAFLTHPSARLLNTGVSINAAPETVCNPSFLELINQHKEKAITVELTEHVKVENYKKLLYSLKELKSLGVTLAIDDVGAGFSGLNHILKLSPDIIKLDGPVIRNIDRDREKQAMTSALVSFAQKTDTLIVAEQIETAKEAAMLIDMGVEYGQGYYLGKPEKH